MTRRDSKSGLSIQLGSISEKKQRKRSRNILGIRSERGGDSAKVSRTAREWSDASREDRIGVDLIHKKPTLRGSGS